MLNIWFYNCRIFISILFYKLEVLWFFPILAFIQSSMLSYIFGVAISFLPLPFILSFWARSYLFFSLLLFHALCFQGFFSILSIAIFSGSSSFSCASSSCSTSSIFFSINLYLKYFLGYLRRLLMFLILFFPNSSLFSPLKFLILFQNFLRQTSYSLPPAPFQNFFFCFLYSFLALQFRSGLLLLSNFLLKLHIPLFS